MNRPVAFMTDGKLHEECGVFGAYDPTGNHVASSIYYGLFALQHRGQESCGIAVGNTLGPRRILLHKDMGLVSEVFDGNILQRLAGNIGIGHVRYSTSGDSSPQNAQPLVLNYIKGTLGIAHNGNLVNAFKLRQELELSGSIFQTNADTEVIAYHIARERLNAKSAEEAVASAMQRIRGAYSLIVMSPRKLIGVRDPMGFRPLCIGKRDGAYFLASESCALDAVGAEFLRDVAPGEIVTITENGISSQFPYEKVKAAHCIFEYIYFARPDSVIDGIGVYESRLRAGRELARQHPVEADLVVGVPESGSDAALGYSLESHIPYGKAFVKNTYVGRTFIKPTQTERESSVHIKLNVLKHAVCGKRVVMIDDSIVRGTTCAQIVGLLREAGAKEVHVRISSPPFQYPCYFGTDIPTGGQLIANQHSEKEICGIIGADSLGYLAVESLPKIIESRLSYCDACFSGRYPVTVPLEP